jgi:hypothetical protein
MVSLLNLVLGNEKKDSAGELRPPAMAATASEMERPAGPPPRTPRSRS